MKKSLLSSILLLFVLFQSTNASDFAGDVKYWTKSDFLGFDEIGDCDSNTGDISSVFARVENGQLLLRISFDNMVERKSNLMTADNFAGLDINAIIAISDKSAKINYSVIISLFINCSLMQNLETIKERHKITCWKWLLSGIHPCLQENIYSLK